MLETLIAFVIAAVALVVLYRAAFDGAAATAIARRETAALDRAQSRLAALRVMAPAHHYVRAGADGDGFFYRETATRLAAPHGGRHAAAHGGRRAATHGGRRAAPLAAERLTVTVFWGGTAARRMTGREVTLTSVIAVPGG